MFSYPIRLLDEQYFNGFSSMFDTSWTVGLVPFKAQHDIVDKTLDWHQIQPGAVAGVIFLFCASTSQTDKRENNAKLLCKEL